MKTKRTPFQSADESKTYYMKMTPNNIKNAFSKDEVYTKCHVQNDPKGFSIKVYADGFQDKWFIDHYFNWLMYTKYITVVE